MKKALVTGGGGFLGSAIVRQLAGKGIQVVVADRRGVGGQALSGMEFRQGDIRDKIFLVDASRGCDAVFHVAARKGDWGPLEEFEAANVEGTRNVIEACRANEIRCLVHTSTARIFFTGKDICGINELTPPPAQHRTPYARTKWVAEQMVLAANCDQLKTTVLRPSLLWGPGDPSFIPDLIRRGALGLLKKIGNGRNLVDVCYVDNAAAAHVLAADNLARSGKAAGETYFISQGEPVIFWNWVNKWLRHLELPPAEECVSFRKAYWKGMLLEWKHALLRSTEEPGLTRFRVESLASSQWFSIEKAERDLGYQPAVSTPEGLLQTVEWIRRGG